MEVEIGDKIKVVSGILETFEGTIIRELPPVRTWAFKTKNGSTYRITEGEFFVTKKSLTNTE